MKERDVSLSTGLLGLAFSFFWVCLSFSNSSNRLACVIAFSQFPRKSTGTSPCIYQTKKGLEEEAIAERKEHSMEERRIQGKPNRIVQATPEDIWVLCLAMSLSLSQLRNQTF